MKATKQIDIYLTRKHNVRLIDVVQYDTGIQLVFTVKDFTIPSGVTATLYVQKPSGKFVYQEDGITVSGNTITVDLHNQAITECGKIPYQVSLKSGSDVITTFTGFMMVEKTLKKAGAVASVSVGMIDEVIAELKAETQALLALIKQSANVALTKSPAIVCEVEGTAIAVTDASDDFLHSMSVYGKSTQEGTPAPDAPVDIVSIENPMVTIGDQSITIAKTIHGVPVASVGNYTDANGQRWVCDEVDFERGVYIQRVYAETFNGSESWEALEAANGKYRLALRKFTDGLLQNPSSNNAKANCLCSHYTVGTANNTYDLVECVSLASSGMLWFYSEDFSTSDVSRWKSRLATDPIVFMGILATPIETALTEAEINAFSALHSNYPNTTIQNDSGAWMKVKYVADTKTYIDNKIAKLAGTV